MSHSLALALAVVPALLNLGILIYLLFFLPRNSTTTVFALLITALLLWQTEDVISRTTTLESSMRFWDSVLSIGWLGLGPLIFHFVLRFTAPDKRHPLQLALAYGMSVIFYSSYVSFPQPVDFRYTRFWGWTQTLRPGTFDLVQRYFIFLLVIIAIGRLFVFVSRQEKKGIKRKQGLLIAIGILIPALQGVITQAVFPAYLGFEISVTSSFMTIFSLCTIIAFARYRLFNLDDSLNVEGVLQSLQNLVLLIAPGGKLVYQNDYATKILSISDNEGQVSFSQYFQPKEYQAFQQEVLEPGFDGPEGEVSGYETTFVGSGQRLIHVLVSSKSIWNNKKLQGVLLIAHDVTRNKNYQLAIENQNARLREISWIQSHVVRAPLARIMALADWIKNHEPSTEELDECLGFMLHSTGELDEIICDIINKSQQTTKHLHTYGESESQLR